LKGARQNIPVDHPRPRCLHHCRNFVVLDIDREHLQALCLKGKVAPEIDYHPNASSWRYAQFNLLILTQRTNLEIKSYRLHHFSPTFDGSKRLGSALQISAGSLNAREYVMLKMVSVCAALILAATAFSTSADARNGHGGGRGGSFGGMSAGGYRGANVGGFRGPAISGGARYATAPYRAGMYRSGVGSGGYMYGGARYGGRYASGYGYRYRYRRHGYGYWPWALGAGLAIAATAPYYADYGYNDCVQWTPDGWVNVCGYPYGGYGYPYGGYYPY
jgi:hypothetical protein